MPSVENLGQRILQHFIECFHHPISLWVIGYALLVIYLKFLRQCTDHLIQKVRTMITYQDLWTANSCQYILKEELCSYQTYVMLYRLCICPMSQILHYGDNVPRSCLSLGLNGSHKIYCPLLKGMQHHLWIQRHLIPPRWPTSPLTHITLLAIHF